MQRLSDKDYMDKVEEKILRLDAEIAIIDENIASLKGSLEPPVKPTEPPANN
jgi:peptidoglycan hydrolase CwlO-like protein